jgi:anti-sigma-K factor RskA
MAEHDDLVELVRLAAPPFAVPAGLEERVFAAIDPPRRARRPWRVLIPAAAAAAAAAAALVVIPGGSGERYELRGGGAQVTATVETTGVGREVLVEIERLRDPRPEGLYELWFVAAGDDRRRVSAGTFHPDDAGRGTVRLVGAADPRKFPRISVTLEPADGNPRRQGPTVLTAVPVD